MEKVVIVYQTDKWHGTSDRNTITIASDVDNAINMVDMFLEKYYKTKLSEQDKNNLKTIHQTQGHNGDFEFVFEEATINCFL